MKSPIIWGLLATASFYGLIHGNVISDPLVHRYFTHHPVEYGETLLFSIGLAALLLRLGDLAGQRIGLLRSPWGAANNLESLDSQCATLLAKIDKLSDSRKQEYFVDRLRSAVRFVLRHGSTEGLGDELKYLAEADATRSHNQYALFRVIVWAIPILGFLGTVIGITLALNAIDPKHPDESMLQVITGLGLKFDTTAVALSFSMGLMFVYFFVERAEGSLLAAVDRQVENEVADRFPLTPAGPDGQVAAMRRMAEVMVAATDQLIERQSQLWQASMDDAAARWAQMAETSSEQLQTSLVESMAEHARQLAASERASSEQSRRHWENITSALAQSVQAIAGLQAGMAEQAESLKQVAEATGEVSQLQDVLNKNLALLAGAKHFEQTLHGLGATIHLLNARLSEAPSAAVQLDGGRGESTRRLKAA
jgi:biopolymer transport protein ExbB/TolQ